MDLIQIDASNIDREHIRCAIGSDKENIRHAQTKKDWLKARFSEGLVLKRLDARGKVVASFLLLCQLNGKCFDPVNLVQVIFNALRHVVIGQNTFFIGQRSG